MINKRFVKKTINKKNFFDFSLKYRTSKVPENQLFKKKVKNKTLAMFH
jgi:hypothetical protein